MRIIQPFVVISEFNATELLKNIEKAGRICYKSEGNVTEDSYKAFIKQIIKRGHESVLEHEKITVKFVCDRGVSHEIVRHRLAAYSQESTRYCNYGESHGLTFIQPFWLDSRLIGEHEVPANAHTSVVGYAPEGIGTIGKLWFVAMVLAERSYKEMLEYGATPQEARSVLPNSLKTEIIVTYSLREWRHFFKLRADKAAHPQMQQLAIPLLLAFKEKLSPVFDDIEYNQKFDPENYAKIITE